MKTEICIETTIGQDCIEFNQVKKHPSIYWDYKTLQSIPGVRRKHENSNPSLETVPSGPFYIGMSAYGQLI